MSSAVAATDPSAVPVDSHAAGASGSVRSHRRSENAGTYPTAITAHAATLGAFDTEDDFTCSLKFPTGVASAHLSWNAGVRKVLSAAALTYVAATLTAILTLVYFLFRAGILGGRRD